MENSPPFRSHTRPVSELQLSLMDMESHRRWQDYKRAKKPVIGPPQKHLVGGTGLA